MFSRKYSKAADVYQDTVFLEVFGDDSKELRVRT